MSLGTCSSVVYLSLGVRLQVFVCFVLLDPPSSFPLVEAGLRAVGMLLLSKVR
jgi:hypothetical protein